MSNITWQLATNITVTALAMAAVATAGNTAVHAATHHAPAVSHMTAVAYIAHNNNPGPDRNSRNAG